jgi:hypothetical protein
MINREELRKQLPHGSISKVAKLAGVTTKSVNDYFKKKTSSEKVELAALKIASEIKAEKDGYLKILEA